MKTIEKNKCGVLAQWAVFLLFVLVLTGLQSCKKDTIKEKEDTEEVPKGEELVTIKSLLDKGEGTTIDKNTKIVGLVISSKLSEAKGGVLIQDNTGGVFVDIGSNDFNTGDVVSISIGEKTVRSRDDRLQIEGVKKSEVYKVSDIVSLTAKSTSIKDMIDNGNEAERLVKLSNVEVMLLDNWSETNTYRLRDATGWIELVLPTDFPAKIEMNGAHVSGYFRYVEDKPMFYIRSKEDVVQQGNGIQEIENWEETFVDSGRKGPYNRGYVEAASGRWLFDGALVDINVTDYRPMTPRIVGKNKDATVPGPGFIQPDFELENLSRISVEFCGFNEPSYDKGPFVLEVFVSNDQGVTWHSLGQATNSLVNRHKQTVKASFFVDELMRGEKLLVKIQNESEWIDTVRGNRINIDKIVFEF